MEYSSQSGFQAHGSRVRTGFAVLLASVMLAMGLAFSAAPSVAFAEETGSQTGDEPTGVTAAIAEDVGGEGDGSVEGGLDEPAVIPDGGDSPVPGGEGEGSDEVVEPEPEPEPLGPTKAGWFENEQGDLFYYADPDANPLTGWQKLSGTWYYLDPAAGGAVKTGVYKVGGSYYAANEKGAMYANGWAQVDGTWYYANPNGSLRSGWLSLGGTWYYLDVSQQCAMLTGKYKVGRAWYISNASGAMYASSWAQVDGTWYYAGPSGALTTGWQKLGAWYYLKSDCTMASSEWIYSGGHWYYLKESGAMATGWVKDGETWYYTNGSGAMLTGWQWIGGAWYYLKGSGTMASGEWISSGGHWYYLKESGAMATGWVKDGETWYYTNGFGAMLTGWQWIGGAWYYLNGSGAMQTGWLSNGGRWYYLRDSGAMATSWLKLDGTWYYLDGSGAMKTGWQWIGGKWYYMNASGEMLTGAQKIGGAWYYLTESGAMATGWQQDSDGTWYYLNGSGALQTGWELVGGTWYYLDPAKNGAMVASTTKTIGGKLYSFMSSGAMRSNCLVNLGDNVCGYANGTGVITKIGVYSGSDVILKSSSGKTLTGWQNLGGTWFYASDKGVVQKDWLQLGSTWYFLDRNSGAMYTGWHTIDGKSYYFDASGAWIDGGAMGAKAQGYSSNTRYLILVDKSANQVGVFQGSKNNWSLLYQWDCVTGAPGTPTPSGTFKTTGYKMPSLTTDTRAKTATQITGGYFFHSILASTSELGNSLSHGCVRLQWDNARWIYNNIGAGTTVVIYN